MMPPPTNLKEALKRLAEEPNATDRDIIAAIDRFSYDKNLRAKTRIIGAILLATGGICFAEQVLSPALVGGILAVGLTLEVIPFVFSSRSRSKAKNSDKESITPSR